VKINVIIYYTRIIAILMISSILIKFLSYYRRFNLAKKRFTVILRLFVSIDLFHSLAAVV